MKTNLNEEIKRNLKLMGVLNEAPSPSKALFKMIFGSLLGPSLDNAIAKIEAKTGKKLAGKGIKSFEDAIAAGWLTRKQATKYMVEALIAGGKTMDDIVADISQAAGPQFMKSIERNAKAGVDKSEVKALVPELAELSDDLVDALLKKGGYEAIGTTIADTNKVMADFASQFPELFEKNPFFKKGDYKNAAVIAQLQKDINKKFAGKNRTAVADEIKKMIQEAADSLKKANIPEEAKQAWYIRLKEWSGSLAGDIIKAPIKKDQVTGEVQIAWTTARYAGALLGLALITKLTSNVISTGSASGGIVRTGKSEFDAAKKEVKGEPKYEKTQPGFVQYLTKTFGDKGWGDAAKWYIWTPNNDLSLIEVIGMADKSKKTFKYVDDKETYEEIK